MAAILILSSSPSRGPQTGHFGLRSLSSESYHIASLASQPLPPRVKGLACGLARLSYYSYVQAETVVQLGTVRFK